MKKVCLRICLILGISAILALCIFNIKGRNRWNESIDHFSSSDSYSFIHNNNYIKFYTDEEIANLEAVKNGEISKEKVIQDRDKLKDVTKQLLEELKKASLLSKFNIKNEGIIVIGFHENDNQTENSFPSDVIYIYENGTAIVVNNYHISAYNVSNFKTFIEKYNELTKDFEEDPYYQVD